MLADKQEIRVLGMTEILTYKLLQLSHFLSDLEAEKTMW